MHITIQGLDIHYHMEGEGTPLIGLHGMSADHRMTIGMLEPTFATVPGWKRIYPDMPGMGQTKGPDWMTSSEAMLDVLCGFIEAVIPEKSFALAGESYGGYMARGIVHRMQARVDGLLLIAPAIYTDRTRRDVPPPIVLVCDPVLAESIDPTFRPLFEMATVIQTPEVAQRTIEEIVCGVQVSDQPFLRRLEGGSAYEFPFDPDDLLVPFEKPSLIVVGRQDSLTGWTDAQRMLPNYPRASYVVLDRAGHGVHMEQPSLFNSLVAEWLIRVAEAQAMPAA